MNRALSLSVVLLTISLNTIHQNCGMLRYTRSIKTRPATLTKRQLPKGSFTLQPVKPIKKYNKPLTTTPKFNFPFFICAGATITYQALKEYEKGLNVERDEKLEDLVEKLKYSKLVVEDPAARILLMDDPLQWLKNEEQEIWNIFTELGFSKRILEKYQHKYKFLAERDRDATLKEITQEVSACNKSEVLKVLEDFDIDPSSISIRELKDWADFAEHSHEGMIVLNKPSILLQHYILRFIIAHEAQHIKNQDSTTKLAMLHMRDSILKLKLKTLEENLHDTDPEQFEVLVGARIDLLLMPANLLRFMQLQEIRADVYPCLKNPSYAQGLKEWASLALEIYGENPNDIIHPKLETRIALAEKILKTHKKDATKKENGIEHNLSIQPSWL